MVGLLPFGYSVLKSRFLRKKTPINVMWRITNSCNARCSYCSIWKKESKDLPTKTILSLVDEMAESGTRRIGFVGGEALLREDFDEILTHVKSKGIYTTLVTNGCLVAEKIEVIKKLDCLVVSFDGQKVNHERGRMPGSFERALDGIRIARKNGVKVLTNTVLTKYNLEDIDFVLAQASAMGYFCTFNLLQGKSDCYASDEAYRKMFLHLLEKKKEGAPIVLSEKTILYLLSWSSYRRFVSEEPVPGFRCRAGEMLCNIDTDGRIAKCDILTHRIKDNPNCTELGFKEAFSRIKDYPCKACTCTHVIEYNHMFNLSPRVIFDWAKVVLK